jgi:hypothetical protein
MNKALQKARADALRERFRLGAAMADLQRASDELRAITDAHGIDLTPPAPEFTVIEGGPGTEPG